MALGRELLKGFGLNEDQQNAIIAAHRDTVDALKKELADAKAAAKTAQEEAANAKKSLAEAEAAETKDKWKLKYDALKEESDKYKADVAAEKLHGLKEAEYRRILKDEGVPDKRIDAIVRITDVDAYELGEDGKFKTESDIRKSIKDDYSDFIPVEKSVGAETPTPPESGGTVDTNSLAYSAAKGYYNAVYGMDIGQKEGAQT